MSTPVVRTVAFGRPGILSRGGTTNPHMHVILMVLLLLVPSAQEAAGAEDLRLIEAARRVDSAAVQTLLGQGVDVDATQGDGATALHWAAHRDDALTAELLIEAGADVNAHNENKHWGTTALHAAAHRNSKAICASLIAAGLSAAGVRCGCYASPHVERVTERVRLDGEEVSEEALAEALERALLAREDAQREGSAASSATWFDLFTAAAFQLFADAGCEWVVLECGLGGRLDSTNAVDGDVCVLTNVDLEHTAVLGDTIRAIAEEKAAILPQGGVLIVGSVEEESERCKDAHTVRPC